MLSQLIGGNARLLGWAWASRPSALSFDGAGPSDVASRQTLLQLWVWGAPRCGLAPFLVRVGWAKGPCQAIWVHKMVLLSLLLFVCAIPAKQCCLLSVPMVISGEWCIPW